MKTSYKAYYFITLLLLSCGPSMMLLYEGSEGKIQVPAQIGKAIPTEINESTLRHILNESKIDKQKIDIVIPFIKAGLSKRGLVKYETKINEWNCPFRNYRGYYFEISIIEPDTLTFSDCMEMDIYPLNDLASVRKYPFWKTE